MGLVFSQGFSGSDKGFGSTDKCLRVCTFLRCFSRNPWLRKDCPIQQIQSFVESEDVTKIKGSIL